MQICGFQKTTLLDYPEHLAALIFLGGCNFRCPFCQNSPLVLDFSSQPFLTEEEILAYLKKRKNILEGLCISGGEPTLSKGLTEFMKKVKDLGYLIKLDTNGTHPDFIKQAYNEQLIDYVAMDIKSSKSNYAQVCGLTDIDLQPIEESVNFLKQSGITHEFRTTVVREFHNEQTFLDIAEWLKGDSSYYLQAFKDAPSVIQPGLHNYDSKEMLHFKELVIPKVPHAELRGIDID